MNVDIVGGTQSDIETNNQIYLINIKELHKTCYDSDTESDEGGKSIETSSGSDTESVEEEE